MLQETQFLTFLGTVLLFAYVPGPAMLYSASQTLAQGKEVGLLSALGVQVGGYVHVLLATAGLSVLLHAVPTVYMAVKAFGAIYLMWMGMKLILKGAGGARDADVVPTRKGLRRVFIDSVIVDVLNPKTAIFFIAFLPQFIHIGGSVPVWLQFLVLGVITNIIFSSADFFSVFLAHRLSKGLRKHSVWTSVLPRIGGGILVGLGVRLLVTKR